MTRTFVTIVRFIPLTIISATLFYLSSLPSPDPPSFGFEGEDKLLHVGAYFVLTIAAFIAFGGRITGSTYGASRAAAIYALMFGLSDEIHQYFVPGRSCDPLDWVADMIGTLLAVWVLRVLTRSCPRLIRKEDTPGE